MSTWFVIPSKMDAVGCNATLAKWTAQGYRTAVFRDFRDSNVNADLVLFGTYPGYAEAVNRLCRAVRDSDSDASWLVTGGDDTWPDPTKRADDIAAECTEHFGGTFGVMQPTGDRWGEDESGSAYIDRICGSPWMGREFTRRMYGGEGPLWSGYFHMCVDDELQQVAKLLGVLWQRRELIHYHDHWWRRHNEMPQYLEKANVELRTARDVLRDRKNSGFPGHEPIA